MLISDYKERRSRLETKKATLLHFLRDETWSNAEILSLIAGMTKTGIYKTLKYLEKEGFITSHYFPELKQKIWGITTLGILDSWNENEAPENRPYFYPARVRPVMVQHHIDTQFARIKALEAGWSNWTPDSLLPQGIEKRPDAIVVNNKNQKIAIELERSIKTKKRYEVIFSIYLQAIKRGEYQSIHYVCPDPKFAVRLRRMFSLITSLPVGADRVRISEKHKARFPVFTLASWPPSKSKL